MVFRLRAIAIGLAAVASLLAMGCEPTPPVSRDSPHPSPQRVVSLIPAATEILFAIGAGDRVVGRTRWGTHPVGALDVPDVGDGVRPALEAILAQTPDLVILFAGADTEGARARLGELEVPTLSLRHNTVEDLAHNVTRIGDAVGCRKGARRLIEQIRQDLDAVSRATAGVPRTRVYYDVWADPPMTVGRGSFLDSLISIAGGINVFGDLSGAAPQIGLEAIVRRNPDLIVYPVSKIQGNATTSPTERPGWSRVPAVDRGRVVRVDADLLGRLGPRLGDAALELAHAMRPEIRLPAPRGAPPREQCGQ